MIDNKNLRYLVYWHFQQEEHELNHIHSLTMQKLSNYFKVRKNEGQIKKHL